MLSRGTTLTLTEKALAATVKRETLKARGACRRCGQPGFQTFDFVQGASCSMREKYGGISAEAPRITMRIAPSGGPWSRAQLWSSTYQSLTCRRCGSISLPPAAAATTPTTTPTTFFFDAIEPDSRARPPSVECLATPGTASQEQNPRSRQDKRSGLYYGRSSFDKVEHLQVP